MSTPRTFLKYMKKVAILVIFISLNTNAECLKVVYDQYCLGGPYDSLPQPQKVIKRQNIDEWIYPQDTLVYLKNGYVESIIRLLKDSKKSIKAMSALFGEADEIMKSSNNQPISYGWYKNGWELWVADAPKRKFEGWFISVSEDSNRQGTKK